MWFGKNPPDESNSYLEAGLYPGRDKYLYTVRLNFTNPAGRDEYDRLLILDENLIEIVDVKKL